MNFSHLSIFLFFNLMVANWQIRVHFLLAMGTKMVAACSAAMFWDVLTHPCE